MADDYLQHTMHFYQILPEHNNLKITLTIKDNRKRSGLRIDERVFKGGEIFNAKTWEKWRFQNPKLVYVGKSIYLSPISIFYKDNSVFTKSSFYSEEVCNKMQEYKESLKDEFILHYCKLNSVDESIAFYNSDYQYLSIEFIEKFILTFNDKFNPKIYGVRSPIILL